MRCYNINLFYMAGIHAGIQSGHAQKELSLKYLINEDKTQSPSVAKDLARYLEHHKTVIVLNGGMYGDLLKVEAFLSKPENTDYAWAPFRETEYALNRTLTNISLVLPWHMYAYKTEICKILAEDQAEQSRSVYVAPGQHLLAIKGKISLQVIAEHENGEAGTFEYTPFDLELIKLIGSLKLMN